LQYYRCSSGVIPFHELVGNVEGRVRVDEHSNVFPVIQSQKRLLARRKEGLPTSEQMSSAKAPPACHPPSP
jgi:hypothetical protein